VSELPAMISENTRTAIARRFILTTLAASSTPVMRMRMLTMLLMLVNLTTAALPLISRSFILTLGSAT